MLPLLERVVGHLKRVRRVADKEVVERDAALDHDRFEALVLERLDHTAADATMGTRHGVHWRWEPTYLRAFVEELHWGLLDGVGARWSAAERFALIEAMLMRATGLEDEAALERLAPSRMRLLDPLIEAARQHLGYGKEEWRDGAVWNVATYYCDHLGLTRASAGSIVLDPAGAMLVRLRGIDRLRWLLAIETSLATSDRDSWCVDLVSVRHLATNTGWTFTNSDPEGPPISDSTFGRWTELGALRHWEDDHHPISGYDLTPLGRELFEELARDENTSFRVLARALLEDDRERALARESSMDPSPDRATAATLRHARMVAHEIRNALLPVKPALKKIWASPALAAVDLSEPRHRIDEGLARVYRFIDDSLRLTPIALEETTTFSLMEAIDEARRECVPGPEGGIQIETVPASANPQCRGHQGRLVLALLNLLRNSVQVGDPDVRIRIAVDARRPGVVTIRVHDDGPGVPQERRATLFENGISHRDGGSGHGLSLVRTIIEDEMGGRIRLVEPPDGLGACFELELPNEEELR